MIEKTEGGARLELSLARALRRMAQKTRLSSLDVPILEDAADALEAQDVAPAPLPALESLRDEWIAMGEAEISSQMSREQVAYHNGEAEAYRCCGRDLDAILTSPAYTEEKKK
jgi:hypothetical protein